MRSYQYIARDLSGMRKEGFSQAASSADVLNWLREQGFTPVSVSEVSSARTEQARQTSRRRRIKSADLAALCWQLHTMVEGGITLTTALETIAEDIENSHLQEVLQHICEKVEKGQTFSESLAECPKVFNRLSCAMILAGESGGTLPAALYRLGEYYDNRDKLAKKVKGAMAYPCLVFVFVILIVTFIMTFIVPRFQIIFDQFGGELPAFTRAFMNFYNILRTNIIFIIGSILLLIVLCILASKTPKGHGLFSRIALKIPLIGRLISQAFLVMFCRTMATLLGAGVSVLEIFNILSGMTNNDVIKNAVVQTRQRIVEGSNVSSSLAASGFFPNMVVKMVQVGEESGSLTRVLDRTSVYYERKVDSTITTVTSLLEPVMIITVGAVVLVVVLALYLPIFTMRPH